jgi:hypothetical protein
MFTLEQIEFAHSKVKSGADFPKFIQEIKSILDFVKIVLKQELKSGLLILMK